MRGSRKKSKHIIQIVKYNRQKLNQSKPIKKINQGSYKNIKEILSIEKVSRSKLRSQ